MFRLAARDCPRGLIEWGGANAELKALLGGTPDRDKPSVLAPRPPWLPPRYGEEAR